MRIELENVSYTYAPHTPFAREALHGLSLAIEREEFVGLVGPTGSGKSTLIRLIAGLAPPSTGRLRAYSGGVTKGQGLEFRQIGVVFQQPEDQLFAATVFDEVAYGARNIGLRGKDLHERIEWALQAVGLDIRQVGHRSPFHLGGGEKRFVAIASVLVMQPSFLILDEPTANLDARGRQAVLECVTRLHYDQGTNILVASHNLEELLPMVERLLVLHRGGIIFDGLPKEAIVEANRLEDIGLEVPSLPRLMLALRQKGLNVPVDVFSVAEAIQEIQRASPKKEKGS